MTERYFEKFPLINYNNVAVVDITERTVVLSSVYSNPSLYYFYDVEQYERPDSIAGRYYSDPYKAWILYLTNQVVDPYYDWYMDSETFNSFIVKKYGSLERASGTIKFYRNNWYAEIDTLTVDQFNALPVASKRYYEPIYGESFEVTLLGYRRKKEDKTIATNAVISYNVANGSGFSVSDRVKIYQNSAQLGLGQVLIANSSVVTLQHVSEITSINATPTWYITDTYSGSNTIVSASTLIANNIPAGESAFWSPVYNYDYENELNEQNKSIAILNNAYSQQISNELRDIL